MAPELMALIEAGQELAVEDRYELAYQMLISADEEEGGDQTQTDAAWRTELRQRIDDIASGAVTLVDGTDTIRMARECIARRMKTIS